MTTLQPYLFFEGRCDEAIDFYRRAIGAELIDLSRYKDSPDPSMRSPEHDGKVMHATLRMGGSVVMVSDGQCLAAPNFSGFALTLTVATVAEAERVFAGLGEGGEVRMPLGPTFFAERFGMLADRFGVLWMVLVMPS